MLSSVKKAKSRSEVLSKELCSALLAANILWRKLEVPQFRNFLEDNLSIAIPGESMLCKKYLGECFEDVECKIGEDLTKAPIWISVDESTDCMRHSITIILLGHLDSEVYKKPCLVKCEFLGETNSSAIARLVNDALCWSIPILTVVMLSYF